MATSINPTTAAATPIGPFGATASMVGLDIGPGGGLFGVEQTGAGGIFSINTTTGAATRLFNTSFSYTGDVAYSGSGNVFYGTAGGAGGDHLIRIDTGSSTATDEGLIAGGLGFSGLAFDRSGRLIALQRRCHLQHPELYDVRGWRFLEQFGCPGRGGDPGRRPRTLVPGDGRGGADGRGRRFRPAQVAAPLRPARARR